VSSTTRSEIRTKVVEPSANLAYNIIEGFVRNSNNVPLSEQSSASIGSRQQPSARPGEIRATDFVLMQTMEFQPDTFQNRGAAEDRMSRHQNVFKEEMMIEIGADRRDRRRYDIDLALHYKVLGQHHVDQSGAGKAVNLSAGGIAIAIGEVLTPGSTVELAVAWPVLLNQNCPLKLVVTGKVVRSTQAMTAIRMERYEFRTLGTRTLQVRAAG
jgi:hypothetical protein